ncbi:MAG: hypothetical protein VX733_14855 [Candidatus Latescibacterota bacterium]|nr:hypothetical protein [Candidatus Latescibacterota bacterium]
MRGGTERGYGSARNDGWNDSMWHTDEEVAAHLGVDFWSVDYRIGFNDGEFPPPTKGTVWGFNMVRVYRGQEYAQWVRTYDSGHTTTSACCCFTRMGGHRLAVMRC